MTTAISLLAPGAKIPGYATYSSICLKQEETDGHSQ
jgi:hypothetical protein